MHAVAIRGEMGASVTMEVEGYERPDVLSDPDSNWLSCTLRAEIGRFRAVVNAALTTTDFVQFSSELAALSSRTATLATFSTMEESLALRMEADHAGRIKVSGTLTESTSTKCELHFSFDSDLSFLDQARLQVEAIVSAFPVRATSSGAAAR